MFMFSLPDLNKDLKENVELKHLHQIQGNFFFYTSLTLIGFQLDLTIII